LHARRIRIDAPGGGVIDVTAELPAHFAETLATLGFQPMAGDMLPIDRPDPARTPQVKERRVAAAAKARRKERKGERRARGTARGSAGKLPGKSSGKPTGKPTGKPPGKGGRSR
jgi:23S rRNA pseudouridine955/2504/2580 synthase